MPRNVLRPPRRSGLGAIALALLVPLSLEAQTGAGAESCDLDRRPVSRPTDDTPRRRGPRLECTMIYRGSARADRQEERWMSAVVLWRVPRSRPAVREGPVGAPPPPASTELRFRALQRAAEDSGRSMIGGFSSDVIHHAAFDRDYRTLFVGEQRFAIPLRDSALVVLIDQTRDSAHTPVIVGTAYIPGALPDSVWQKHWVSGDTTYLVRGRGRREAFTAALRAHPTIRAFLDSPH